MEARLYRLTIALSLLAVLGFGIAGTNAYLDQKFWHADVLTWLDRQEKHRDGCRIKPSKDCNPQYFEDMAVESSKLRSKASLQMRAYTYSAIGIPASLFLLFFGGRWITTGKLRKSRTPSQDGSLST